MPGRRDLTREIGSLIVLLLKKLTKNSGKITAGYISLLLIDLKLCKVK